MHLHKEVDNQLLQETILKFTGKIKQLPPIKSAVKREVREREIYEFEILEIKGEGAERRARRIRIRNRST